MIFKYICINPCLCFKVCYLKTCIISIWHSIITFKLFNKKISKIFFITFIKDHALQILIGFEISRDLRPIFQSPSFVEIITKLSLIQWWFNNKRGSGVSPKDSINKIVNCLIRLLYLLTIILHFQSFQIIKELHQGSHYYFL